MTNSRRGRASALERTRAELAASLAGADAEARRRADTLHLQAEQEASRVVERANAHAEVRRVRMEREVESRRRAEIEALAGEIGRTVAVVILDLFASGGGPSADAVFARAARDELRGMFAGGAGHVVIECARPLSDETREALHAAIGAPFEQAEVRLVPELVAGIRVTCDAGLVDASARGLARHAGASIAHAPAAPNV